MRCAWLAIPWVAAGCVSSPDEPEQGFGPGQPVTLSTSQYLAEVYVELLGESVARGPNDFYVEVRSGSDAELSAVTGFMPAHGHGTDPALIEPSGEGFRAVDLSLYMRGRWEVGFDVLVNGQHDSAVLPIDVE